MIKFDNTIVMQGANNDDVNILKDGICYHMPLQDFRKMLIEFMEEHPLKTVDEIIKNATQNL